MGFTGYMSQVRPDQPVISQGLPGKILLRGNLCRIEFAEAAPLIEPEKPTGQRHQPTLTDEPELPLPLDPAGIRFNGRSEAGASARRLSHNKQGRARVIDLRGM